MGGRRGGGGGGGGGVGGGGGGGGRRGNAGVWTKCSLCPQSRAIVTLIIAKCYFWGWICKMFPFLNWYVSG